MTALTSSYGGALIIVDGQVLEVFQRKAEGANRIPLAWLGAWLDTTKARQDADLDRRADRRG